MVPLSHRHLHTPSEVTTCTPMHIPVWARRSTSPLVGRSRPLRWLDQIALGFGGDIIQQLGGVS